MRRITASRPSPAIIVAVLALVAALAGTAIAGTDATTSASVKKQVKELKKRVTALEQTDQVPGPQGEQGEPGPPGEDATNLFAYIRDKVNGSTANVQYGSGVTAVDDPEPGHAYVVTFDRSVVNCVVQATPGFGDPVGDAGRDAAMPTVEMYVGGADEVNVLFWTDSPGGITTDTSFFITAFC
jgi:hypothetical protein